MAETLGRRAPRRLISQPAVPVRHPTPVPSPVLFKSGTGFPVDAAGVGGVFFTSAQRFGAGRFSVRVHGSDCSARH